MSMSTKTSFKKIAIVGGGPAALYLLKEFTAKESRHYTIDIFEAGARLGCGMPYSKAGANPEHITNISGNEIPELITSLAIWINQLPASTLEKYGINKNEFDD